MNKLTFEEQVQKDIQKNIEYYTIKVTEHELVLIVDSLQTLKGSLDGYHNEVYGDPEEMTSEELNSLRHSLHNLEQKLNEL